MDFFFNLNINFRMIFKKINLKGEGDKKDKNIYDRYFC